MSNSRKKRRDNYRASQIDWRDVWELPLHLDEFDSYAFSKNGVMALTFVDAHTKWQILENRRIVAIINGSEESDGQHEYIHNGYADISCDAERIVFSVRGWGYLTGTGGLHLSEKDAARIQDNFIEYILNRLNGKNNA